MSFLPSKQGQLSAAAVPDCMHRGQQHQGLLEVMQKSKFPEGALSCQL